MDGLVERGEGDCRTILLVEDDEAVRQVTGVLLGGLGYRVLEAAQAPAALALLEAEQSVDLLLTDIAMPGGMSGLELAAIAVRRHPALRVIVTSGDAAAVAAVPSHAAAVLQKPYRFETLTRALDAALL
jgi:CheY-like chemotaxis protein